MTDQSNNGNIELLRTEIIESEKVQADFLKWKFILIATVGSVSLGFTSRGAYSNGGVQTLLCVVPLLCAYVDLISLHIMGRVITIGKYLMCTGDDYENFVFAVRGRTGANLYAFEAFALHGSSFVLNAILLGLGFFLPERVAGSAVSATAFGWYRDVLDAYMIMGGAGLGVTALLIMVYEFRRDRVDRLANEFFKEKLVRKAKDATSH